MFKQDRTRIFRLIVDGHDPQILDEDASMQYIEGLFEEILIKVDDIIRELKELNMQIDELTAVENDSFETVSDKVLF